jgi:hypothetical protein
MTTTDPTSTPAVATTSPATSAASPEVDPRRWKALMVIAIAQLMVEISSQGCEPAELRSRAQGP